MTGGNQLLIGAGWSLVVLVAAYRIRRNRRARSALAARDGTDADIPASTGVELQRSNSVAIAFLLIATARAAATCADLDAAARSRA